MSLREELVDKSRASDVAWLASCFPLVSQQFSTSDASSRNVAAETCSIWAQKFGRAWQPGVVAPTVSELDALIICVIDRWSQGDPSYKLALKKFLNHIFVLREKLYGHKGFADLVLHTVSYAKDDQRICYGVLDCIARSSPSNCSAMMSILPPHFVTNAFAALVEVESSNCHIIGRFLVAMLGNQSPQVWYDYTAPYIASTEYYQACMAYFIQPVLMQHRQASRVFAEYFALCDSLRTNDPSVEIGVLKAAKNAKLEVGDLVLGSSVVRRALVSPIKRIRYDALLLLCNATRKLTTPVPPMVYQEIIASSPALLAEGDPKSRSDVYSALRNLLIRVKTSNSDATELLSFVKTWCAQSLAPGSPYRCLAMATRLLQVFEEYDEVLNDQHVISGLVNGIVSDFADIREHCVRLLGKANVNFDQHRHEMEQMGFRLVASSRGGDAGARILQFLANDTSIGDKLVDELQQKLDAAEQDITAASQKSSIHGYFIALRLIPTSHPVISLVEKAWKVCSPPLMALAPEGMDENTLNFCWKASKECALLIESCTPEQIDAARPSHLLDSMATMLADMTHWGAFSAIPPAYIAVAKRLPQHALDLVWRQINELESRTKSRSVTRRSAGLPMLVTSSLIAQFDSKVVDALFKLATLPFVDGEAEELEMPQVHGMNCLRAVLTDSDLTKPSAKFVESGVQLALQQFRSPSWSLRNCAAMLFTSLFKRLFGVRGLAVPASVFFQRYRSLKGILLAQLLLVESSGEHPVFPALAVLAQLQTISATDDTLTVFWEPIITLLSSPSWKIREMAARVVSAMTHADVAHDAAVAFVGNMTGRNANEMHGFAMAVNHLLAKASSSQATTATDALHRLEQLIKHHRCMETTTELYKAWVQFGGNHRLVDFEDLPSFPHLNPSVATFEAEQVKQSPAPDSMRYVKGWTPVLRSLSMDQWTVDLALSVLKDPEQLPDIQVLCLKALENQISENGNEVASQFIDPSQALSVRQEALVLASKQPVEDPNYLKYLLEFGGDDAPVESRRSAVRSIDAYLEHHQGDKINNEMLYLLFRLLSDEEEDIRDSAAAAFCSRLGNKASVEAAAMCEKPLLRLISPEFLTEKLANNLVEDTKLAVRSYNEPEELLFVIEEESLFRDEMRSILMQAELCASATPEQRQAAEEATQLLSGVDHTTPLRAANKDVARVEARVAALQRK